MTRVKVNNLYDKIGLTTQDEIEKFESGWSLSEIRENKEFIDIEFHKEVEIFKKNKLF